MKLSSLVPALQLATAATAAPANTGLVDFGRSLHLNNAPVERLRQSSAKSSKVFFVEEEVEAAAELASEIASSVARKTGKMGFKVLAGKASISDGSMPYYFDFQAVKSAKATKVLKPRADMSVAFVLSKSSKAMDPLSYEYYADDSFELGGVESKSSKTDVMSVDFSESFVDLGSMDFGLLDDYVASTTAFPSAYTGDSNLDDSVYLDDAVEDIPTEEWNDEEEEFNNEDEQEGEEDALLVEVDNGLDDDFGRLVFE
jgi:hypothetical protein